MVASILKGQFAENDPPRSVHIVSYWHIRSASGSQTISCAGYQTPDGLEMRVQYSDEQVVGRRLFRGPDARRLMDAYAREARTEIEKNPPAASSPPSD